MGGEKTEGKLSQPGQEEQINEVNVDLPRCMHSQIYVTIAGITRSCRLANSQLASPLSATVHLPFGVERSRIRPRAVE